jgi:hypothetical protein
MVITNNGTGNTQYIPAPLWFQFEQWQNPAGQIIQQMTETSRWLSIVASYDDDAWDSISQAVGSNLVYQYGLEILQGQTTTYYIPLIGNWLEAGKVFLPGVDGDLFLNLTFYPNNITKSSGPDCTFVQLSLDLDMDLLDGPSLDMQIAALRTPGNYFDYVGPFWRTQQWTQTLNAGAQYTFNLSGIKGDVMDLFFMIRDATLATDTFLYYIPFASYQINNSGGVAISGQQLIDGQFNRLIQSNDFYPGSFFDFRSVYSHIFSRSNTAFIAMIHVGMKQGAYPFTTNEQLLINTMPQGTNEVITVTPSAAIGGGSFVLSWIVNGSVPSIQSVSLPYNVTNAALNSAIEGLLNFQGTVTITGGPLYEDNPITITFGSAYQNMPLAGNSNVFDFDTSGLSGGAAPYVISFTVTTTTPGVYGITGGNTFNINVYALTSEISRLTSDGQIITTFA